MTRQDRYAVRRVPELVGTSGHMLIHFYSDVAYNMTGFNITFSIDSCPSERHDLTCSGRGSCVLGKIEIFLEQIEVAFLSPSKISLLKFKFSQILLGDKNATYLYSKIISTLTKVTKVEKLLKGSLDSIPSPSGKFS